MQALFFLPKAGMTAKTRQKRQPVWTTLIVVSHKKENLRARKRQLNSLPKDAPLHHYAGWANWTADRPTPQRKSPNAKSTAVKGDLCNGDDNEADNGAKVPIVSAIMLLACAFVAFAR